jgi:hypothetical protein
MGQDPRESRGCDSCGGRGDMRRTAVIATLITFTGSHPSPALAALASGGASAAASIPATIRARASASTKASS